MQSWFKVLHPSCFCMSFLKKKKNCAECWCPFVNHFLMETVSFSWRLITWINENRGERNSLSPHHRLITYHLSTASTHSNAPADLNKFSPSFMMLGSCSSCRVTASWLAHSSAFISSVKSHSKGGEPWMARFALWASKQACCFAVKETTVGPICVCAVLLTGEVVAAAVETEADTKDHKNSNDKIKWKLRRSMSI